MSAISDKSIERLIRQLGHSSHSARYDAVLALAECRDERAVEPLIHALKTQSQRIRAAAAEALGVIGSRRAVPALIQAALHDCAWQVRREAVRALGRIGDPAAVEALRLVAQAHSTPHCPEDDNVADAVNSALEILGHQPGG
ncbi:MAG: hypothetical protein Kow00124_16900 [Anaerolineae bacterium]